MHWYAVNICKVKFCFSNRASNYISRTRAMFSVLVYLHSGRVTPGRNVNSEYWGQRPGPGPGGRPWPRPRGSRRGAGLWADPRGGAGAEKKWGEATWATRPERGVRTGEIEGVYLLCPALIGLILKLMKTLDPPFELKKKNIIILFFEELRKLFS